MQANTTTFRQRWSNAKLKKSVVFWIAVGAVLLTLFLGFTRGGWTTEGSATNMAENAAAGAVVERLTSICVAQFSADPEQGSKLADMQAITSSSKRIAFVKEQGWATMPGETTPDSKVATQCANQLMLIDE
ncbi:MAG: hypothetical protein ACK2UF_20175 [Candidatus Promineifilaceae bacterium]|jgi:hypothetical protein